MANNRNLLNAGARRQSNSLFITAFFLIALGIIGNKTTAKSDSTKPSLSLSLIIIGCLFALIGGYLRFWRRRGFNVGLNAIPLMADADFELEPISGGFEPDFAMPQQITIEIDLAISAENNKLLAYFEKNPPTQFDFLSRQEIQLFELIISGFSDQSRKMRHQQNLNDYRDYIKNGCCFGLNNISDDYIKPITIEETAARGRAQTYDYNDFREYIESCNARNMLAVEPEFKTPLHNNNIRIYPGVKREIAKFVEECRGKITAANLKKSAYGKLFSRANTLREPLLSPNPQTQQSRRLP